MACSTDFFFCNSPSEQRSPAARASFSNAINIPGAHQPGVTQERGSPTEREYVGAAHIEKVWSIVRARSPFGKQYVTNVSEKLKKSERNYSICIALGALK